MRFSLDAWAGLAFLIEETRFLADGSTVSRTSICAGLESTASAMSAWN